MPASTHLSPAPLTAEAVRGALWTKAYGRTLHLLEETPSTNGAALTLAQEGAEDGTVVVAERQTAGRGRLGRGWYSPRGENLYCSVILRRTPASERLSEWLSWVPLVSAVAAARAVQDVTGSLPSLKWPNDILVGPRKLGGVLCESSSSRTSGTVVVVGIGLNVNTRQEAFPDDLRDLATSLVSETGRLVDRSVLLAALLGRLEERHEALLAVGPAQLMPEYKALCATLGRAVRITLAGGEIFQGRADSLGTDGSLRVVPESAQLGKPAGGFVEVRAGDVVHLR